MGEYPGAVRRRIHLGTVLLWPPSGHRPGRRQARHAHIFQLSFHPMQIKKRQVRILLFKQSGDRSNVTNISFGNATVFVTWRANPPSCRRAVQERKDVITKTAPIVSFLSTGSGIKRPSILLVSGSNGTFHTYQWRMKRFFSHEEMVRFALSQKERNVPFLSVSDETFQSFKEEWNVSLSPWKEKNVSFLKGKERFIPFKKKL